MENVYSNLQVIILITCPGHKVVFTRIGKRSKLAVNVTNPGARGIHHDAMTLPHLEGELILLSPPYIQAGVISSKLPKESGADGK